ncbi:GATOR complex protein WDR24 [Sitophilus oryzae]|uniref:GATOR2 complex protein WDR24 n=1 Tax=Sitophilus oryzae TaxID=7048 RepID=A0A6J2YFV0_SITOR|nr:GATOR complex protein WDR24 [Sitophilus oryzae]
MTTFCVSQEGPVNALALNRDNNQVAIGGRNVFKVYQIEDDKFREVCNLRNSKHLNSGFSCNDVAWSLTDDHYLATAATNGHVCVWNLSKTGRPTQEQDYQDHKRTVNKVNFHATEPFKLISGSQDGTMRYFDIRVPAAVTIFQSNTESIRDVQFSPHNAYMFCAVSDNGSVQLWDVRKPEKFQQQFTAHSGPVFACDWHPESPWLATSSRDKTIKVWDLTAKPTLEYTIHTIASIGHVKWRPQYKFHIASCALVIDCSINVWDIRRPYIPFASFTEHKDIASGVVWKGDPNVFLSSGRDSTLYHHSFSDGQRPASKANPQGVSLNNRGEVIYSRKINYVMSNSNSCSQNSLSKAVGLMRKTSTTQAVDNFHQASSCIYAFRPTNSETEESSVFLDLAKNYVLCGRTVSELCERNSAIAKQFGKHDVALTWKIMGTMYGEEFVQHLNASSTALEESTGAPVNAEEQAPDTPAAAQFSGGDEETENEDQVDNAFPNYLNVRDGCLPRGDFFFGENELDVELDGAPMFMDYYQYGRFNPVEYNEIDWTLPIEAFDIRHEILDRSPPPEHFPHHSPDIREDSSQTVLQVEEPQPGMLTVGTPSKKLMWDPSSIVVDTLQYYSALGDVQTTATILIVLGDSRKYLTGLSEALQEHWLLGYIDLLSRYKMWNTSTQVIKLSWLPSVSQLNQQSTTINTNCGKCLKPLQRAGWLCDRCHTSEYGLCSVCNQVVKGTYVWCQGCSHGGHIFHMRNWMSDKTTCATGCGHVCEYN